MLCPVVHLNTMHMLGILGKFSYQRRSIEFVVNFSHVIRQTCSFIWSWALLSGPKVVNEWSWSNGRWTFANNTQQEILGILNWKFESTKKANLRTFKVLGFWFLQLNFNFFQRILVHIYLYYNIHKTVMRIQQYFRRILFFHIKYKKVRW